MVIEFIANGGGGGGLVGSTVSFVEKFLNYNCHENKNDA